MGRHLRVQLRCWSNSGDARCLRDIVFVRFYVLMLGYLLTLRFELPKLLTLVVSFSLWQPTPSHPLPLLLHQVDTSFTPLLLLLLTLLVFLLCKNRLSQVDICPIKSEEENIT